MTTTTTAPAVPTWRTHAACSTTPTPALQRAVRLGVVEHRGRGLYPVRR
jgi:hypothetical protein